VSDLVERERSPGLRDKGKWLIHGREENGLLTPARPKTGLIQMCASIRRTGGLGDHHALKVQGQRARRESQFEIRPGTTW
jgi:hypothetical protein